MAPPIESYLKCLLKLVVPSLFHVRAYLSLTRLLTLEGRNYPLYFLMYPLLLNIMTMIFNSYELNKSILLEILPIVERYFVYNESWCYLLSLSH